MIRIGSVPPPVIVRRPELADLSLAAKVQEALGSA